MFPEKTNSIPRIVKHWKNSSAIAPWVEAPRDLVFVKFIYTVVIMWKTTGDDC